MKRFRFRLARLEKLRAAQRREARAALALAIGALRECENAAHEAAAAREAAERAELGPDQAFDPAAWRALAAWREATRARERTRLADVENALAVVREAEAAHAAASRAHRVLERLHERRLGRWSEEASREDQKFLDEIHLLRLPAGER